jgi:hypothetical protein
VGSRVRGVDGGVAGGVAGWRVENTGAGGRAKNVLGTVQVEYIYSSARMVLITFTPLHLLGVCWMQ